MFQTILWLLQRRLGTESIGKGLMHHLHQSFKLQWTLWWLLLIPPPPFLKGREIVRKTGETKIYGHRAGLSTSIRFHRKQLCLISSPTLSRREATSRMQPVYIGKHWGCVSTQCAKMENDCTPSLESLMTHWDSPGWRRNCPTGTRWNRSSLPSDGELGWKEDRREVSACLEAEQAHG